MKKKLPVLTVVLLLVGGGVLALQDRKQQHETASIAPPAPAVTSAPASGSTNVPAAPAEPTAGDHLLKQARTQLERRTSVTARLRHQVALDGRQLFGVGSYSQQGTGEELRMRLELQFAADETSLLQISNGRTLWTDQRLPAGRSITKLDLRKVRYELTRAQEDLDELEPGRATWTMAPPEISIRSGGLPTLLTSLSNRFRFSEPQSMRWTPAPKLEGQPDSFPVFAVVGRWKPEILAQFLSEGTHAMPERLPQEVLILFGQTDLFPYRIEYRRSGDPAIATNADGQRTVLQPSNQPLVLLELFAVSLDGQIAVNQFEYSPGDAEWTECTDDYLEGIRLHQQTQMATRKKTATQ
jgi:hypothetical protein